MANDRLRGEEINLTHDEVGRTLGLRSASATDTLYVLPGAGAIRSSRGQLEVKDRGGLENIAGNAYSYCDAVYRRLIRPFGKSPLG